MRAADSTPVAHGHRLEVVDGLVSCPHRGPVDVGVCFACPACRGLTADHLERVICAWQPPEDAASATPGSSIARPASKAARAGGG